VTQTVRITLGEQTFELPVDGVWYDELRDGTKMQTFLLPDGNSLTFHSLDGKLISARAEDG
jgi:hypothetical protein